MGVLIGPSVRVCGCQSRSLSQPDTDKSVHISVRVSGGQSARDSLCQSADKSVSVSANGVCVYQSVTVSVSQ